MRSTLKLGCSFFLLSLNFIDLIISRLRNEQQQQQQQPQQTKKQEEDQNTTTPAALVAPTENDPYDCSTEEENSDDEDVERDFVKADKKEDILMKQSESKIGTIILHLQVLFTLSESKIGTFFCICKSRLHYQKARLVHFFAFASLVYIIRK